jgi:hypothetical protein
MKPNTENRFFSRVARWYIFEPKTSIWVNFGGSLCGRCWYFLCPFGTFYGDLIFFGMFRQEKCVWQPYSFLGQVEIYDEKLFLHKRITQMPLPPIAWTYSCKPLPTK